MGKRTKILLLFLLTLLSSFFLGRVFRSFFILTFFDFLSILPRFIFQTALGLVFVTLSFSLLSLFLEKKVEILVCFLNTFVFWLGFCLFHLWQGIVLALFYFVCQYLFFLGVKKRAKMFVDFFPRDIFLPKISTLLFYLSLLFSLAFFFAVQREIKGGRFTIPQRVFEQMSGPLEKVFQESFERSLEMQFGKKLEKEIGTQNPEEVARFLQEEMEETAREGTLRQRLGFRPELFTPGKIKPGELKEKMEGVIQPFLKYLPFVAALALFLTFRFVNGFLLIFLPFLLSGMFWFLLKVGVFKIVEEEKKIRRLSL